MTQKIANRPPHNAPFGNVENGVVRMIPIWISFFDELFSKLNTLLGEGPTEQSATGTEIDFTSIPAGTRRIYIMFDEVSLSGADDILVQIGDIDGFETTGYKSTSARIVGGAAPSIVSSTSGFILNPLNSTQLFTGHMLLTLSNIATEKWISSHMGNFNTANAAVGGGAKSLSNTLRQIRITRTGANTFDNGDINIQFE